MDPITHTFTGAALAAAGLRRTTPLATAALLMAANAPDVDVFFVQSDFHALEFRRGWTHGILALPIWPFVLTGVLLAWDRWVRRRRDPTAPRARAGPLLAVSSLGVLTHPTLDWLNNYGLRWLMPFSGQWFYGDALFVIDPWVWLVLGGALFVRYSQSRAALAWWTAFWAASSVVVLANTDVVPPAARAAWIVGLAAVIFSRVSARARRALVTDRAAAAALAAFTLYCAAAVAASATARAQVRAALAATGVADVEQVMVAPAPANPFSGDVVAVTADEYYLGQWRWLARPRLELDPETLPRPRGDVFDAAARAREARQFLTWSRFPVIEVESAGAGAADARGGTDARSGEIVVRFSDARYRDLGRLEGPEVRLDASR